METKRILIEKLQLDLDNFRTVHQGDEIHAIDAMIAVRSDHFWALMKSLIDSGYLPIENILVIKWNTGEMVVRDGNRRIAAMKLIYGLYPGIEETLPRDIKDKIHQLSDEWKHGNQLVPCAVYTEGESSIADNIVALAHGKDEAAGRDPWTAMARARHNRDVNMIDAPELILIEKYLEQTPGIPPERATRWSGNYPLTVLEEVINKISSRFGVSNATELANQYPSIQNRVALDSILNEIGFGRIKFKHIRDKSQDFAATYFVPEPQPPAFTGDVNPRNSSPDIPSVRPVMMATEPSTSGTDCTNSYAIGSSATGSVPAEPGETAKALADPKHVKVLLKKLKIGSDTRAKVVTLRNEALHLNLKNNPIAFCFLIRSMFELSAKAYCDDHKEPGDPQYLALDADGRPHERKLADILKDISTHLQKNGAPSMKQKLHGASTELYIPNRMLSITSMNQLVHSLSFSIPLNDIAISFSNIFPLLEAMNR